MDTLADRIDALNGRMERIEEMLQMLVERQTVKHWYTTAEAANLLGKSEYNEVTDQLGVSTKLIETQSSRNTTRSKAGADIRARIGR
jgi:hypothetical protein